ncbi:MAG: RES family NAD+ phosphorylase [Vulcanimicrobiaceae bacterium]
MRVVWRICNARFVDSALAGEGASRFPGRWNLRGTPIVYASTTPSLAFLELLVNVDRGNAPDQLALLQIHLPYAEKPLAQHALPADWNALPAPESTREFGSRWIVEKRALAIIVPSIVLPTTVDANVLINPAHPDARKIVIAQTLRFSPDPRTRDRH